ncbi:uncharacterized protein LOC121727811 [Aricia agestis]|uniref:uncharacterized protein LOC121727811 n=1 Tax=Aricia agestis TaxID=91739 RepID=UPI001C2015E2|nr:uncharacterized protein LOC121727811 [Aricia agestis]
MTQEVKQISLDVEYKKHKNISPEDIKQLREWVKTQPHLPEEHLSDLDLILTYYCCDTSDLFTKQVLDLHFTLRTLYSKFFKDRVVDNVTTETLQNTMLLPLSESDKNGVRYLYLALRRSEPKFFNLVDAGRVLMMIFDLWQYEEGTWPGLSIIVDLELVVLGHLSRLEFWALRQIIHFLQDCMLVKINNIYFINAPNFTDKLLMLLKPLMSKELYSKIQVYDSKADLSRTDIPVHGLPKENGGKNLCRQELNEKLLTWLQSSPDYFVQENFKRVNESLRPTRSAVVEEAIGVGSFKKLDID